MADDKPVVFVPWTLPFNGTVVISGQPIAVTGTVTVATDESNPLAVVSNQLDALITEQRRIREILTITTGVNAT